jgi:leader peptidase (prepilin peptidase)/N-methyltransferase
VPLALVFAVLLGLAVGSFLTVVVDRVPAGQSVVAPRSRCPHCQTPITWAHNIPLVSWILLRGRCSTCHAKIGYSTPLLEAGTALLFALVTATTWPQITASAGADLAAAILWLVAQLAFAACALALGVIDWHTHLLPNPLTYGLAVTLTGLCLIASLLTADWGTLLRAICGGAVLAMLYLAIAFIRPGAMGLGDAKYAYSIGLITAWAGWGPYALGVVGPFLLGGILVGVLLAARKLRRRDSVPFGPMLSLGALVALIAGGPILQAYLGLWGLA